MFFCEICTTLGCLALKGYLSPRHMESRTKYTPALADANQFLNPPGQMTGHAEIPTVRMRNGHGCGSEKEENDEENDDGGGNDEDSIEDESEDRHRKEADDDDDDDDDDDTMTTNMTMAIINNGDQ